MENLGFKNKRDNFPFIKHMCKSSSEAAQRPTGREGVCSGVAFKCDCVGIYQYENGLLD